MIPLQLPEELKRRFCNPGGFYAGGVVAVPATLRGSSLRGSVLEPGGIICLVKTCSSVAAEELLPATATAAPVPEEAQHPEGLQLLESFAPRRAFFLALPAWMCTESEETKTSRGLKDSCMLGSMHIYTSLWHRKGGQTVLELTALS